MRHLRRVSLNARRYGMFAHATECPEPIAMPVARPATRTLWIRDANFSEWIYLLVFEGCIFAHGQTVVIALRRAAGLVDGVVTTITGMKRAIFRIAAESVQPSCFTCPWIVRFAAKCR